MRASADGLPPEDAAPPEEGGGSSFDRPGFPFVDANEKAAVQTQASLNLILLNAKHDLANSRRLLKKSMVVEKEKKRHHFRMWCPPGE